MTAVRGADDPARIAVIATCHDRRETTLAALAALRGAARGLDYRVYLVDDGSRDGTGDAVRAAYPETTVIAGDGTLFWNGGMRRAWQAALAAAPDYYLLLNDDLRLLPQAITRLLALQRALEKAHGPRVITVGKVTDAADGGVTYGGYARRRGLSRLGFRRVPDGGEPCVTMNGNCVIVPARAVDEIGLLSPRFTHDSGDIDYGLRASAAGYRIVQSDFAVGHTDFNAAFLAARSRLTWSNRRYILTHPKGIPAGEWLYFCRSHAGWLWPINFVVRYLKILRLRT